MKDKKISIIFYFICIVFIALPITSLVFNRVGSGAGVISNSDVMEALMVTLRSTGITMAVVFLIGTPAAYGASRGEFRGKKILDLVLDLPMVLPPAVAGLLLLMTFGKNGIIGHWLYARGIRIPFSITAVVMAQIFVALPIYIKTVREGFNRVGRKMELTAMTLGDSQLKAFFRVTLPMAKSNILTGGIMAWARATAEFGATIMFAGNLKGKTQTLPLAIYSALETDLSSAIGIARFMVIFSLGLLLLIYFISKRGRDEC